MKVFRKKYVTYAISPKLNSSYLDLLKFEFIFLTTPKSKTDTGLRPNVSLGGRLLK